MALVGFVGLLVLGPVMAHAQLPTPTPLPLPTETSLPSLELPTPTPEPDAGSSLLPTPSPSLDPQLPLPTPTPSPEGTPDLTKNVPGELTGLLGGGGDGGSGGSDGGEGGPGPVEGDTIDTRLGPAFSDSRRPTGEGGGTVGPRARPASSYAELIGARFGTLAHRTAELARPLAAPLALGAVALGALALVARGPGRLRKIEDEEPAGGRAVFRL